jgi:hypothetical protein
MLAGVGFSAGAAGGIGTRPAPGGIGTLTGSAKPEAAPAPISARTSTNRKKELPPGIKRPYLFSSYTIEHKPNACKRL